MVSIGRIRKIKFNQIEIIGYQRLNVISNVTSKLLQYYRIWGIRFLDSGDFRLRKTLSLVLMS